MAVQMTQVYNATWRLEHDVMNMQMTRMDYQLKTTKLSTEIDNLHRHLDNNNRRVDDLELDLYMLRTKYKDAGPRSV
jgi:septation ring formation regulator EzrA